MITHQILITFDPVRDFRDRRFANYDSTHVFCFLKKRSLLDDETLVSFSEVSWAVVPEIPAKVTKLIGRYRG